MKSRTLNKQLKKNGLSKDTLPDDESSWLEFLQSIEESYMAHEEMRYLLERSLEISSKEMEERIEQNRDMSRKLIQASKMSSLGTLASGIAHELNNPLTGILGFAQIIQKKSDQPEVILNKIERIIRLSKRMSSIIGHLRKLSRSSSKKDMKVLKITEPISETFELLGKQLIYDKVSYTINGGDGLLISGEPIRLESVFQNLVTNSYQAFLKKPEIANKEIKVDIIHDSEKNICEIQYTDNAGGIPQNLIDSIFDPFFTTKEVGEGTGLGLSITKKIIEDHGGKIRCHSVDNQGTTFYISFPITQPAAYNTPKHSIGNLGAENIAEQITSLTAFQHKIILVDDEPDICEIFSHYLESFTSLKTFTSPLEAYEYIQQNPIDLLITDIKMPGMDGFELASKTREKLPQAQLVFMSGHADINSKENFSSFGKYLFFPKPLEDENLFIKEITNLLLSSSEDAA